jgi:hypothetical protein
MAGGQCYDTDTDTDTDVDADAVAMLVEGGLR